MPPISPSGNSSPPAPSPPSTSRFQSKVPTYKHTGVSSAAPYNQAHSSGSRYYDHFVAAHVAATSSVATLPSSDSWQRPGLPSNPSSYTNNAKQQQHSNSSLMARPTLPSAATGSPPVLQTPGIPGANQTWDKRKEYDEWNFRDTASPSYRDSRDYRYCPDRWDHDRDRDRERDRDRDRDRLRDRYRERDYRRLTWERDWERDRERDYYERDRDRDYWERDRERDRSYWDRERVSEWDYIDREYDRGYERSYRSYRDRGDWDRQYRDREHEKDRDRDVRDRERDGDHERERDVSRHRPELKDREFRDRLSSRNFTEKDRGSERIPSDRRQWSVERDRRTPSIAAALVPPSHRQMSPRDSAYRPFHSQQSLEHEQSSSSFNSRSQDLLVTAFKSEKREDSSIPLRSPPVSRTSSDGESLPLHHSM